MPVDHVPAMSKKLAAREVLSWSALRLTTERGLENVRVKDIAAEVGVAARTFNNYFSSKEEAICAIGVDRQARIRDTLRARPAEEPLWDAVIRAILEQYSAHGESDSVSGHRALARLGPTRLARPDTAAGPGVGRRWAAHRGRDIRPRG